MLVKTNKLISKIAKEARTISPGLRGQMKEGKTIFKLKYKIIRKIG